MAIVASRAGAKCGPDAVGLSHLLFAQQDTTFLVRISLRCCIGRLVLPK